MRPSNFQEPFVALRNIPYSLGLPADGGASEGGVLCQGQLVWVEASVIISQSVHSETAFLEGVGIISVDPHWLASAPQMKEPFRS